jgi:hypothetical protein
LDYEIDTGIFRWKITSGRAITGHVAGRLKFGYRHIKIGNREYRAHRLAWFIVHGRWPKNQLDHRNGNKDDNRLVNLREATNSQNQSYRTQSARQSKTGFRGVHWHRGRGKFYAQIMLNKESHWLGYFPTAEAAHAAYLSAKSRLLVEAA